MNFSIRRRQQYCGETGTWRWCACARHVPHTSTAREQNA